VNFMNVGPWEFTVVLIIAILLIGPKRVAEIIRTIGRVTAQMRRMSGDFMRTIQTELHTVEQETNQAIGRSAENKPESMTVIPPELEALGRETRQALAGNLEDTADIIEGERTLNENSDE